MTRPPFEVADIAPTWRSRPGQHRAWVSGRIGASFGPSRSAAPPRSAGTAIAVSSARSRPLVQQLPRSALPEVSDRGAERVGAAREQELLPVGYVHIVFTMPEPLARLALVNKRVVYDLLFQAAADTLLQVASNPKRLGAAIGGLMVLHTWGQRLQHHPHVHCVVPAGGLAPDGTQWIHARPRFFLPIPVLRQVFRGKLVAASARPFGRGASISRAAWHRSPRTGPSARSSDRSIVVGRLRQAALRQPGPRAALPRALHAPRRHLQSPARGVTDDTVSFRWKDYRHGNQIRTLTLDVDEFLRRFSCTSCRSALSASATSASSPRGVGPRNSHSVARRWRRSRCPQPTP